MKDLIISMPRLRHVVRRVEHELQKLGLWVPEMEDTQVYLIPAHLYYGFMMPANGNIYIPRVSLSKLSELVLNVPRWSILDIIRHEYGHIFAHHNEKKLCTKAFKNGFGEPDGYFDPSEHITYYAATSQAEDFAEIFRFFVRSKGRPPQHLARHDGVMLRWDFLSSL